MSAAELRPVSSPRLGLLWLLAAQAALLALGAWLGWIPVLLVGLLVVVQWRLGADCRPTALAAMAVGTFTLVAGGHLTRDLSLVTSLTLLAFLFAWSEYGQRGWKIAPSATTLALALWIGVPILWFFLGMARGNSPKAAGLELAGVLAISLALLGPLWRASRHGFWVMLAVFTAIALSSSVFGLMAFAQFHRRISDAWFSPIPAMGALFLLSVAVSTDRPQVRVAATLLCILPLVNLLLSFTRGYWLGFLAGVGAIAWSHVRRSANRSKAISQILVVSLLGAVLLGGSIYFAQLFAGGALSEQVGTRFGSSFSTETTHETGSNIVRLVEWETVIGLILKNPIVGYGLGATFVVKEPFFGYRMEQPWVHHMVLFQWFKFGIMGLFTFYFLFHVFIREAWRASRQAQDWRLRACYTAVLANTILVLVICLINFAALNVIWVAQPIAFFWGMLVPVSIRGCNEIWWNHGA